MTHASNQVSILNHFETTKIRQSIKKHTSAIVNTSSVSTQPHYPGHKQNTNNTFFKFKNGMRRSKELLSLFYLKSYAWL